MLLAIDSSAGASAAVIHNGGLLASWRTEETTSHAEVLAPAVQRVLTESGLPGGQTDSSQTAVQGEGLEAVVVGVGPAPFTGLRVGLALAHSLAEAWRLPLHGVCSLDSLALRAVRRGMQEEFAVATDARRREIYWALYRPESSGASPGGAAALGSPFPFEGPHVSSAVAVPAVPVVGVGASLYPETLSAAKLPETQPVGTGPQEWIPDAVELGLLAEAALSSDPSVADGALVGMLRQPLPLYLRESDATVPHQMQKRGGA